MRSDWAFCNDRSNKMLRGGAIAYDATRPRQRSVSRKKRLGFFPLPTPPPPRQKGQQRTWKRHFPTLALFPLLVGFPEKKTLLLSSCESLGTNFLVSPSFPLKKYTRRFRANDRKRFTRISFVKVWGFSKPRIEMSHQFCGHHAKTRCCPTKRGEQRSRPCD